MLSPGSRTVFRCHICQCSMPPMRLLPPSLAGLGELLSELPSLLGVLRGLERVLDEWASFSSLFSSVCILVLWKLTPTHFLNFLFFILLRHFLENF